MPAERNPHLERELSLAELVNRVLDRGAVIRGDVVISVAGVDLIHVGLQVVLAAIEAEASAGKGVGRAIADTRMRNLPGH